MNLDVIKNLLKDISQFEIKEILDNSHYHSNHISVQNSGYYPTHIEITVLDSEKLNRVEIHRLIYQKLESEILKGLHSIEIKILNT